MSELQDRTPANRRAARIVTATIVAGGIALAGGTAYADANSAEEPRPAPVTAVEEVPPGDTGDTGDTDQAARDVFFAAGYTYDDAVVLGGQWAQDPWEAKVTGGRELGAGRALPIAPGSSTPAPQVPDAGTDAVDAFFAAGYTYDDAVALGTVWDVDPYEAKVTGGQKLLAGETLPVAP